MSNTILTGRGILITADSRLPGNESSDDNTESTNTVFSKNRTGYINQEQVEQVARRLNSQDALEVLGELMVERGVPEYIRSVNGGEFRAKAVQKWLSKIGSRTLYIARVSPWEKGYNESFNGRLQDERLKPELSTI